MKLIVKWLVLAVAIYLTTIFLPTSMIAVSGGFKTALLAALILSLANIFVRPILLIVSLPITILTLGLFAFVINALMLYVTAAIVNGFEVNSFLGAIVASILIGLINAAISMVVKK